MQIIFLISFSSIVRNPRNTGKIVSHSHEVIILKSSDNLQLFSAKEGKALSPVWFTITLGT